MAPKQHPNLDDNTSRQPSPNKFDADWADDWESAFQDDNLDLGELTEEFSPALHSPEPPRETARSSVSSEAQTAPSGRARARVRSAGKIPLLLKTAVSSLLTLLTLRKIIYGGLGAALLLSVGLLIKLTILSPIPPTSLTPDDPFNLESPATGPPAALNLPPPEVDTSATEETPLPAVERHQLKLAGFFIPIKEQDQVGAKAYLQLDLALTIRLPSGQKPDPTLAPLLRDTIFRFYLSQDPATLRRFSLARGEMLRDLQLWLEQQEPELEIDTIAFERYWID